MPDARRPVPEQAREFLDAPILAGGGFALGRSARGGVGFAGVLPVIWSLWRSRDLGRMADPAFVAVTDTEVVVFPYRFTAAGPVLGEPVQRWSRASIEVTRPRRSIRPATLLLKVKEHRPPVIVRAIDPADPQTIRVLQLLTDP